MKKKWIKFLILYKRNKIFFWGINLVIGTIFSPIVLLNYFILEIYKKLKYDRRINYYNFVIKELENKKIDDRWVSNLKSYTLLIKMKKEKFIKKLIFIEGLMYNFVSFLLMMIIFISMIVYNFINWLFNKAVLFFNKRKKGSKCVERKDFISVSRAYIQTEPYKRPVYDKRYIKYWEVLPYIDKRYELLE